MIKNLSIFSPILGMVYLLTIMWWLTGYTPVDLIDAIVDTINQPLLRVFEALR